MLGDDCLNIQTALVGTFVYSKRKDSASPVECGIQGKLLKMGCFWANKCLPSRQLESGFEEACNTLCILAHQRRPCILLHRIFLLISGTRVLILARQVLLSFCATAMVCPGSTYVCVDLMMLPSYSLTEIGNSAILMLIAGDPFMRKWEEAPESDNAYSTRRTSRFVMNSVATLADCCNLPSATIYFHIYPLVLN